VPGHVEVHTFESALLAGNPLGDPALRHLPVYSPNDDAPLRFDLPLDEETGERREDVIERWRERDPVNLVSRHADGLRTLKLLWIECGSRDEWNLHHGARILSARLTAEGIEHVHETFDDDHRSLDYRYDVSLPRLAAAIQ